MDMHDHSFESEVAMILAIVHFVMRQKLQNSEVNATPKGLLCEVNV